ncbi:MAG: RnfABCDGE type electron transport complex subunit G [Spirochaetaceae bacterium]|nr:MAG: RnfABCDGE type electron transport complex subunit G [Spirochaetaceae bacterium]
MKDFIKLVGILFITGAIAAGSLSAVYQLTREPIAEFAKQEKIVALKEVFSSAKDFKEVRTETMWEAYDGQTQLGRVFLTETAGYGGPVKIVFGVNLQNEITAVKILSHTETPGLGAKIALPAFTAQFAGKKADSLALKKDNPAAGNLDAVTGATISSRAAVRGIINALKDSNNGNPAREGSSK